jgi:hypothetical protein
MIEKDRFKPTLRVYKILMIVLARAGYTHMVFTLFKRVRFNFVQANFIFKIIIQN